MIEDGHEETHERDYVLDHKELIREISKWRCTAEHQPEQKNPCRKAYDNQRPHVNQSPGK